MQRPHAASLVAAVCCLVLIEVATAKSCKYVPTDFICSGLNEPCLNAGDPIRVCEDKLHTVCTKQPGSDENKCTLVKHFGEVYRSKCQGFDSCNSDVDASSLVGASCKEGRCQLMAGMPGDYCSTGDECLSGTCGSNNKCHGESENEYCQIEGECEVGLYCDTHLNRCVANKEEGEPCRREIGECAKGLFCDGTTCRQPFSLDNGDPAPINGKYLCSSGYSSDSAPVVCQEVEDDLDETSCDPDHPQPGYACECARSNQYENRQEFFAFQKDLTKELVDCIAYSPCHAGSDPFRVGSCNYYFCAYQVRGALCAKEVVPGGDMYEFSTLPKCLEDEYEAFFGDMDKCMASLTHSCATLPNVPTTMCVETKEMGVGAGIVVYAVLCAVAAVLAPTLLLWVNHCRRTGMCWDPKGFFERCSSVEAEDYANVEESLPAATSYGAYDSSKDLEGAGGGEAVAGEQAQAAEEEAL